MSPDNNTLAIGDFASNRVLYYSFLRGPAPACAQCVRDPSNTRFRGARAGSYNPGAGGPDGVHPDNQYIYMEGAVSGTIWRFKAPYPGLIGPGGVRLPAQR